MTRNTKVNATAIFAVVGASSIALADFSGFYGQNTLRYYGADGTTAASYGDASFAVLDIYASFDAANTHGYSNDQTHVLNALDTNIFGNNFDLFYHSDLAGSGNQGAGSWKPSFSLDVPGTANPNVDSFVTLGGSVGAGAVTNATTPDPNLGNATSADIFNKNVGWFLNPPTSVQGDVDNNLSMWLGRFVVTGDDARSGANFDYYGSVGYNYGEGTGAYFGSNTGQNFTFVPGPAAIAFLGLGGAFARRRRS